jgi:hypothetical protein
MRIECTEDHSLFDDKHQEIKPSEIFSDTELEYYKEPIVGNDNIYLTETEIKRLAIETARNTSAYGVVPESILNTSENNKKLFLKIFAKENKNSLHSKSIIAAINFINGRT